MVADGSQGLPPDGGKRVDRGGARAGRERVHETDRLAHQGALVFEGFQGRNTEGFRRCGAQDRIDGREGRGHVVKRTVLRLCQFGERGHGAPGLVVAEAQPRRHRGVREGGDATPETQGQPARRRIVVDPERAPRIAGDLRPPAVHRSFQLVARIGDHPPDIRDGDLAIDAGRGAQLADALRRRGARGGVHRHEPEAAVQIRGVALLLDDPGGGEGFVFHLVSPAGLPRPGTGLRSPARSDRRGRRSKTGRRGRTGPALRGHLRTGTDIRRHRGERGGPHADAVEAAPTPRIS